MKMLKNYRESDEAVRRLKVNKVKHIILVYTFLIEIRNTARKEVSFNIYIYIEEEEEQARKSLKNKKKQPWRPMLPSLKG